MKNQLGPWYFGLECMIKQEWAASCLLVHSTNTKIYVLDHDVGIRHLRLPYWLYTTKLYILFTRQHVMILLPRGLHY